MDVVILVPRRADGGWRDTLWRYCRRVWEQRFPEWRIVEGHHDDGLFNRSAAVNRAAVAAGDWDVAVIIDSDVVVDERGVRAAVAAAAATGAVAVSHDQRYMLTKRFTQQVIQGKDRGSWSDASAFDRIWDGSWESCSCCTVVPRRLWDAVGGFDEAFVGWGNEDWAFRLACETMADLPMLRASTKLFHLWHPVQESANPSCPTREANRLRWEMYEAAHWNPRLLAEVRACRSPDTQVDGEEMIPQLIHRTVPKQVDRQLEAYWRTIRRLHPGWELRTWKEPLDPADFPLTSGLWDKCESGAQKADIVRLELLVTHGGIYVDSDVEGLRPFTSLLSSQAFAGWEDNAVIPNAVMGCIPNHPAFIELLTVASRKLSDGAPTWQVGPGATTSVLKGRDDVLLLPPGSLYPYHYLEQNRRRENFRDTAPWAFCVHHWHGSWLSPEQRREMKRRQRR